MHKIRVVLALLLILAAAGAARAQFYVVQDEAEEIILTPAKHYQRLAERTAARQEEPANAVERMWASGKDTLNRIGLEIGADISHAFQRSSPDGKETAIQGVYYPYLTWDLFRETALGSGQLNVNYTLVRYWGAEAQTLQARTGLAVPFNDYPYNQEIFSQFSFTHTLPGIFDWLSITSGQFPLYNFDGSTYMDNQQTALMNYALSQNASAAYPSASFGAYLQANLGQFSLAGGYQDATNVTGKTIDMDTAFDGKYTVFGYAAWNPTFGFGQGQYQVLYYYQPAVNEQDENVNGWSFNMQQNLGENWAIFSRANGSDKGVTGVKNSYAFGAALLDPLDRNPNDAILAGIAYNRLSDRGLGYPFRMRAEEMAVEIQWVWGIGKLLTITPDFQMSPRAGLGEKKHTAYAFGIRTTLML